MRVERFEKFVDDFEGVAEVAGWGVRGRGRRQANERRVDNRLLAAQKARQMMRIHLIFASVLEVSSRTLTVRSICFKNSHVSER